MPPRLSVVVPVHNEESFLPTGLEGILEALDGVGEDFEVLLVENGSTDGTDALARQLASDRPVEVLVLDEADYGAAMRRGFLEARGEWVVNFDIDYFSADFLRSALAASSRADLVIGSKRDPASSDRRPPVRRLATKVFNLLLRSLLGSHVSDTHGMKAFRRDLVLQVLPSVVSRQDLFDTELVVRAERAGFRIVEVPVVVEELREARSSLLRRVPRTLRGLLRIRRLLRT